MIDDTKKPWLWFWVWIWVLRALSPLVLEGCSMLAQEKKIHDLGGRTEELLRGNEPTAATAFLLRTEKPRVAGEMVHLKSRLLPDALMDNIGFVTRGHESFLQILEDLSRLIAMPIRTTEISSMSASSVSTAWSSPALRPMNAPAWGAALPTAGALGSSSLSDLGQSVFNFEHQGSVKMLLDDLAAKSNVSWRFNPLNQSIEFFRYETRTFSVSLPAGFKSVSAGISLSGVSGSSSASGLGSSVSASAQSSSGAGSVSVSQTLTIHPWSSIMDGVRAILNESHVSQGAQGSALNASPMSNLTGASSSVQNTAPMQTASSAIANPELGMITVTARPLVLARVERYIASINERFAHNVMIDVKIFSVALDEQNSLGFGINMLYAKLGQWGATLATPSPLRAGVDTPGILTLSPPAGASNWSGSTVVAQALAQWGKVALQRQGQVLAINGQPSPIQVANEISYVASSSTTSSANVGSITTQNTGSKVVGFTANFLPLILGDNRILLSYQMQISSLASPLTPNALGIQTPNIASQSLQQQAFVNDGQAIVLFGYDEQRSGADSALTWGGFSKSNAQARQMMVIVLQVNSGVSSHAK